MAPIYHSHTHTATSGMHHRNATASTIFALALGLILLVGVLCVPARFIYLRYLRKSPVQDQESPLEQVEHDLGKAEDIRLVGAAPAPISLSLGLSPLTPADIEAGRPKAAHGQSTLFSRWTPRLWKSTVESDLAPQLVAVVPSLQPIHQRVWGWISFWKTHEHIPFTLADVRKALAENDARGAGQRTAFVVEVKQGEDPRQSSVDIPTIVIHPCDEISSYVWHPGSAKLVAPNVLLDDVQDDLATPVTPSTPGLDFGSPAMSEPDSPAPVTPTLSLALFPSLRVMAGSDVSSLSTTTRNDFGDVEAYVDSAMFDVSPNPFVLAAPPVKKDPNRSSDNAGLGLGLGHVPSSLRLDSKISTVESEIRMDAREEFSHTGISPSSSTNSVVHLVSVLDGLCSDSSLSSSNCDDGAVRLPPIPSGSDEVAIQPIPFGQRRYSDPVDAFTTACSRSSLQSTCSSASSSSRSTSCSLSDDTFDRAESPWAGILEEYMGETSDEHGDDPNEGVSIHYDCENSDINLQMQLENVHVAVPDDAVECGYAV